MSFPKAQPAKNNLGLSLSGGGYRASTFHLGTLKKLHELDILDKVDVISTISGGSITGAAWAVHDGDYPSFHKKMAEAVQTKDVIKHIYGSWAFIRTILLAAVLILGAIIITIFFRSYAWVAFPMLILFFILLFKYQFLIFPVSSVIEEVYNKFFYQGKTFKDLKKKPLLAIGSSNLHTGRPFTFSQVKMSDSAYTNEFKPPIKFKHEHFPVARAVMASSCVPFAFTPVVIDGEFFLNREDAKRAKPVLVDGGVYDNQGIQKLTQPGSSYECNTIITSDAGGQFRDIKPYKNTLALLLRTVDLFMYRIKAVQMVQNIYENVGRAQKPIAYFSLGWRIDKAIPGFVENMCKGQVLKEVIDAHKFEKEWIEDPARYKAAIAQYLEMRINYDAIKERDLTDEQWNIARTTSTNLKALKPEQVEYLIRQAENLTEIQVKLYCPELL